MAILIENCNRLENKMDNPFHEMCNYTFDYADANMQSEKHYNDYVGIELHTE